MLNCGSMPAKRTSYIWNHFTFVGGKTVTCKHCNKSLAYTPSTGSNLNRHIRNKHHDIITNTSEGGNKSSIGDVAMEVYTVEEIQDVEIQDNSKTYEISMKSFEEMEKGLDSPQEDAEDTEWTPDDSEDWRPQITRVEHSEQKERKVTRRSAVWNHFEKSSCKTSALCVHCGKKIRLGTVSNLARHLRHLHSTIPFSLSNHDNSLKINSSKNYVQNEPGEFSGEIDGCTEVIELNIDNIQDPISVIERKINENASKDPFEIEYVEVDTANVTQGCQTEFLTDSDDFNIYDFIKPKKVAVAEQINHMLVKMIVKGCYPINIVEQNDFKEFVNLLNSQYKLPSLNKLTKELITDCYKECEKKAYISLKQAEGVSLNVGQCTYRNNTYMTISANIIDSKCKLEALFLCCYVLSPSETAASISERIVKTTSEWEIKDKVVAVVTDNTNIMYEAVTLCDWLHIPNFIRSLRLIVHESLKTVKTLTLKVKTLIEEFTNRPSVLAKIYSNRNSLNLPRVKLIAKVKEDWMSSFTTMEMLIRFVKLKMPICQVRDKENIPDLKWLTESEWKVLKTVVDILQVFRAIKEEVFQEKTVLMSKIFFYIKVLKTEMKKFQNMNSIPSDACFLATTAESAVNREFKTLIDTDLISNVFLLDPRLKKFAFDDNIQFVSACSKLKKEVCEVLLPEIKHQESTPDSVWYAFDEEVRKLNMISDPIGKGISEFENYLQEELLSRVEDPLLWWSQRKAIYPRLFKLSNKYLCIVTNSSDFVSFKSANMMLQNTCSNSSSTLSEILFLHHNM